jgi:hypothetical protein
MKMRDLTMKKGVFAMKMIKMLWKWGFAMKMVKIAIKWGVFYSEIDWFDMKMMFFMGLFYKNYQIKTTLAHKKKNKKIAHSLFFIVFLLIFYWFLSIFIDFLPIFGIFCLFLVFF